METIIQGDCLVEMRKFADKSFDLVLTDPPYGIGAANDEKTGIQRGASVSPRRVYAEDWDGAPPSKEYFREMRRVSKNQIIFGGNYFGLPASPCWIVWDKDNGANGYADCELAWTSFKTAVRRFRFRWQGMLQEDMKHKEIRQHPTQKPVELFKWIIEKYSTEGQSILDPFAGSGTTGVAAKQLKRNCTLIEISPKYVEIIKSRLSQEMLF